MVSLFALGQGSIVMNGGKLALGEMLKMGAKMLAVDAISTGVSDGTSEICQAMGCPGGLTLVLSLLAGMGTSADLGSKVFGNGGLTPDDIAYQRYWDEGASGVKELGAWEKTNEAMSDASRNYQKFVTGAEDGMVYKVNGVKFDGFKDGVLMETKGNYSNFVNKGTGEFQSWFNGKESLIS